MSNAVSCKKGLRDRIKTLMLSLALFVVIAGTFVFLSHSTADAVQTFATCTPFKFFTYPERLHIECVETIGGTLRFFAVSTADAARAARTLSVITSAQALGRPTTVLYDTTDTSGTAFGCAAADCRNLLGIGFGQ